MLFAGVVVVVVVAAGVVALGLVGSKSRRCVMATQAAPDGGAFTIFFTTTCVPSPSAS